ncbi:DUF7594 domain-containing protein [Mycetocola zhujimingii]|uniref:CBM96 family carbohydrate-binding protein n=1 Tax=Mycetocola zhujimingii TaxID=2079792 RepID=UPI000D344BF7|nr:LamG-like jellyroll fold domain-containing protein [Mycetocola zhujimingii]AWB87296.1 hypothetical protein C3E77_12210 [Mycetocola zhujimingii]
MRSRALGGTIAVLTLVTGLIVGSLSPQAASALSPGVHFSAENLPTWQTNGVVYALGQSNGKVIAGGTFSQIRPPTGGSGTAQTRNALAVFNAETGAPDPCQFTVALSGGTPTIRAIVTSDDGNTVYVGGNFSSMSGVTVARVAAIDVNSCSVRPLRTSAISSVVYGLAVKGNTLYLAGAFKSVAAQERLSFAAVNATTGALLPWVANTELTGRAVAVSPDGSKVAVGGDFFFVNGQDSHSIGVVDAISGANVRNYPVGFIPSTSVTKALYSSGDTFYGGNEGTGGGVFDGRFAISWNTLEQKWRDTCLGATQALLEYRGTVYAANHAHDCSSNRAFQDGKRTYFTAQNAESAELLGWNPLGNDGTGEGIGPRALVISNGNSTGQPYLWSGGEFTRINNTAQQGLTRFSAADTGAPPTPVASAQATSSGSIQVRFRAVVDSDDSVLTYRIYRNNASTPVWEGTANSQWWKRPQVTFVDTAVNTGTQYSYRVTASDGTNTSGLSAAVTTRATASSNDYPAQVRADGAQLYWQYDGTTGVWIQDKSATATRTDGMSGIAQNGVARAADGAFAGDTTGSAVFDDVDDNVWEDNYVPGPSTYSIETWIKTTTTTGGKIIGYGNGRPRTDSGENVNSGSYDRHIYMDNSGRLTFGVYTGAAVTIRSASAYNDGGWHHIVATQGAGGMALYVDGLRVGQNGTTNAQSYHGVWRVGGDNLSGWPDRPSSDFFGGQIDETAVYGGALTRQQVLSHYTLAGGSAAVNPAPDDTYGQAVYAGDPDFYWRLAERDGTTARDSSTFGSTPGVYGAGVERGSRGIVEGNSAVTMNGAPESLVATTVAGGSSSTFAAELWFRTSSTSGGKLIGFENTQSGNGSDYDKQIYMTNSGSLIFGVYTGGVAYVESPISYNDGSWHHVVGVQDATGMKLYVDGSLINSNGTVSNQSFTGYWRVGGGNINGWPSQPSNFYFAGSIDEAALYSRTLTAQEIANHHALGVNDSTAPAMPENVDGRFEDGAVTLSWDAASDDTAVQSYRVYRGESADFTADSSSFVDEVTETSWTGINPEIGTAYYRIVAVDGSGNVSAPTSAVAVTVTDTIAPSVPSGVTASAGATSATITWTASTDNVGVATYALYRGNNAGFEANASNRIAELTGTSYTDTGLQPGSYFYRVTAVDAAGNVTAPSEASGEVVIAAPDRTAPTAPTDVSAGADQTSVTVEWEASTDNVGVVRYSVHRGTTSGFAVNGSTLIAETTETRYVDAGLEVGTYYYKVTAADAAGNVSAASGASNPVTIVIVDSSAPTAPVGVTAQNQGSTVQVDWSASSDNVAVTGYTVYRGATVGFAADATSRIGDSAGTSYSDPDLANGTYYYRVTAVDAAGNVSAPSEAAAATVGQPVSDPIVMRVTPTEDAMVYQSSPATNYGQNNQLSARGAASNSAFESFLKFPLPVAPPGMVLSEATITTRTSTDATAGSTDTHTYSLAASSWAEDTLTWNNRPTGSGPTMGTLTGASATNTVYTASLAAGPLAGLTGQNVSLRLTSGGGDNLRLWSSEASNVSYRPVLTLTFRPGTGPEPDTTAPSVPTGVSTAVNQSAVTVSWSASTDSVGVTGYSIYRGATSDFPANATSRIAGTSGTSFTDSPVSAGTWYYRIDATDAAGNLSAPSAAVAAIVSPPSPAAVTVQVPATDDAMVVQAAGGTNYGSNTQLSARGGGTAQIESFLHFDLPTAPIGYTLTGATFTVRTSTDPAAGSIDTFTLSTAADGWTEAGLTWNNRPTTSAQTMGTMGPMTATNTQYVGALSIETLGSLLGQTVSARFTGNGSDNVRLWSTESGTASYRPMITLTYTPNA